MHSDSNSHFELWLSSSLPTALALTIIVIPGSLKAQLFSLRRSRPKPIRLPLIIPSTATPSPSLTSPTKFARNRNLMSGDSPDHEPNPKHDLCLKVPHQNEGSCGVGSVSPGAFRRGFNLTQRIVILIIMQISILILILILIVILTLILILISLS